MKHHAKSIILTCAFSLGLLASGSASSQEGINTKKDQLLESVYLSQDWLNSFQQDDGLYHYVFRPWGYVMSPTQKKEEQSKQVKMAPGETPVKSAAYYATPYPDDDNIVRQILSYWAQIKSTRFRNSPKIMQNIADFEKALEKYLVIEETDHGTALFVSFKDGMKVNSTALYLAALLSKQELGLPVSKEQEKHIEYAINGLKVFAAPENGFYYYHKTNRPNFITSYGSGEAQYALALYINKTKDEELYKFAQQQFEGYFETYFRHSLSNPMSYVDKERVGYHTWALYYLSELDKFKPVNYDKYVRPLVKFAFDFKAVNDECKNGPCIYSVKMWDSSSVEGLAAAYPLILKYEQNPEFIQQVKDYLDDATDHLLSLQINSIEEYEQKTGKEFTNNPDHLIGGFCDWPDCTYLRNEVTMHVASALMAYYNLFYR